MEPHTLARETRDARYDGLFIGEVVEVHPGGNGQVRVLVPGICEPKSSWALPLGAMRGVKNGIHWVPEVGSNVGVWFREGHTDHPFYLPGPFGAPKGVSDVPPQAPQDSPDVVVIRWRDIHFTLDGREGQEKVTLQDLTSGTKLEIIRASGNLVQDVEGSKIVTVKQDLQETVELGNETHTVAIGGRTTAITANDVKTVGGNEVDTVTGSRTETIGGAETKTVALASTETVGLAKTLTAALAMALSAGAALSILAGAAVSITGAGVSTSSSGPASATAAGLQTNNFMGGITETVTGAVTKTINGAFEYVANGLFKITGSSVRLGLGPFKKLSTEDLAAYVILHGHPGFNAPPTTPTPPGPLSSYVTQHVTAS